MIVWKTLSPKLSRSVSSASREWTVRRSAMFMHDAEPLEPLVQVLARELHHLEHLLDALEREVLALGADERVRRGDQRVHRQQPERRRAVDQDQVVLAARLAQRALQGQLAAHLPAQHQLRLGQARGSRGSCSCGSRRPRARGRPAPRRSWARRPGRRRSSRRGCPAGRGRRRARPGPPAAARRRACGPWSSCPCRPSGRGPRSWGTAVGKDRRHWPLRGRKLRKLREKLPPRLHRARVVQPQAGL